MMVRWMSGPAIAGLVAVATFAALGLCAPALAPYSPRSQRLDEGLGPPSIEHPLGQDKLGRDQLSRVIYGARISLSVSVLTVLGSALVGMLLGATAGYFGGWVDELFMRLVEVLLAFPGLLLAIAVAAVLGPSLRNVVLVLCAISWTGYARLVRAEVLSLREREFIVAARALGAAPWRIITGHLVPQVFPLLVVQATFGMAGVVMAEAGLSFLGLGVQPPAPSWGTMLNEGRNFLLMAPQLVVFPGLAVMLTVLGFNLLGDGLRDALDVRNRR